MMEKNTSTLTFVEEVHNKLFFIDPSIKIVKETHKKNPALYDTNDYPQRRDVLCFRYFDREHVVDNGREFLGDANNYSNWFYIGKRVSLEEIKEKHGDAPEYKELIDYMERNNLNFACTNTLGFGSWFSDRYIPMENNGVTYEEYRKAYDNQREKECMEMFDKLREHIGEKVTLTQHYFGDELKLTEELKKVNDYLSVELGYNDIPFFTAHSGIAQITSKDGEILYLNPNISDYGERHSGDKYHDQKEFFGSRIADQWKPVTNQRWSEKLAELNQKSEENRHKFSLMEKGRPFVNPNDYLYWFEYVNDSILTSLIELAISIMEKMEVGLDFDTIKSQTEKELFDEYYSFEYKDASSLFPAVAYAITPEEIKEIALKETKERINRDFLSTFVEVCKFSKYGKKYEKDIEKYIGNDNDDWEIEETKEERRTK